MVGAAGCAGRTLQAGGTGCPRRLIGAQRIGCLRLIFQVAGQRHRILDCCAGALGEEGKHRMGGVAEKRHTVLAPLLQCRTIGERPAAEGCRREQRLLRHVRPTVAGVGEVERARRRVPTFRLPAVAEHGDDVDLFAASDWVVHDMCAGAEPEPNERFAEGRGQRVGRYQCAPGDESMMNRRRFPVEPRPDTRPQSVGADQRHAEMLVAFAPTLGEHGGASRMSGKIPYFSTEHEFDVDQVAGDELQCPLKVGAQGEQPRCTETGDGITERRARELLSGLAQSDHQALRSNGTPLDGVERADAVERARGVRGELDAGADLLDPRRALEHERTQSGAGEGDSGGEPADPGARDDDGARAVHGSRRSGGLLGERTLGGPRFVRPEGRIMTIERRTIWTDDLYRVAHIEIDVRMIVRRQGAHALEFARTDFDQRNAGFVVEMRDDLVGHDCAREVSSRQISRSACRPQAAHSHTDRTAAAIGWQAPGGMRKLSLLLVALGLLGGTAAALLPRAEQSLALRLAAEDPEQLTRLRLAQSFDSKGAAQEVEAALAAEDVELAESFVVLARQQGIELSVELHDRIAAARSPKEQIKRSAIRFAKGFVTGNPDGVEGFAGAAAGDLLVYGDVRDLAREGSRWVRGETADPLIAGLASAGLAVTAGAYFAGGAAAPARAGVSLIKAARRTGRISANLATDFGRLVRTGGGARAINSLADLGRIEGKAGARAAIEGLRHADNVADVGKVSRIAEKNGPATLAILKTLGRGALVLGAGALSGALWVMGAAVNIFLFVITLCTIFAGAVRGLWRMLRLGYRGGRYAVTKIAAAT
jgi:hypothetical protein